MTTSICDLCGWDCTNQIAFVAVSFGYDRDMPMTCMKQLEICKPCEKYLEINRDDIFIGLKFEWQKK
jgi:hypothetical protein